MPGRNVWFSVVAFGLLLAGGCAPASELRQLDEQAETYVARIARVLSVPAAPRKSDALVPPPGRQQLTLPVPRQTIDAVEFARLHRCDLGALVGYRNSPLGRVQDAVARLGYEYALLAAASRCAGEPWLEPVLQTKRAQLPLLEWNALFGGSAMAHALGGTERSRRLPLSNALAQVAGAMRQLSLTSPDIVNLQQALAVLAEARTVGLHRRLWQVHRGYLERVTVMLDSAAAGLCRNGRPTPGSRRLRNVFDRFYVAQLQPHLAAEDREVRVWRTLLDDLSGRYHAVRPAVLQRWWESVAGGDHSEWLQTRQAVRDHAAAWQAVFERCGMTLGSSS